MKRNTTVALVYWFVLTAALFAAGRAQAIDRRLLYLFGGVYVLLSWSSLLVVKFVERRPIVSLGFQLRSPLQTIVCGLGAFVLNAELLTIEIWYRVSFCGESLESTTRPASNLLLEILEQLLWIGFPEEIVNRGYTLTRLRESWGTYPALFVSSFLFGIGHLALGDLPRAIQAGLAGLVYGLAFLKTDSVYAPAIAHIMQNLFGGTIVRAILSQTG
jgi:membrane protease YdiL (CAAX protease family)